MDKPDPIDDLKHAGEDFRRAAEAVVDRVIGPDIRGHLRAATRHLVAAARSALDHVDAELAKRETPADKPPVG